MIEIIAAKILDSAAEKATALLFDVVKRKNDDLLSKHTQQVKQFGRAPPLKVLKATLTPTLSILAGSITDHVADIRTWCQTTKFSDLRQPKTISQIYVELDTYLMPLNVHEHEKEKTQVQPLLQTIKSSAMHCAVLGTAGAGKTTSIQKICTDYFKSGKVLDKYNFPILIKLRNIDTETQDEPIFSALKGALSIFISTSEDSLENSADLIRETENKILINYLDDLNIAILLDGFDELPTEKLRSAALKDISKLTESLKCSRLIITSRSSDFRYRLANIEMFEIASLNRNQIEEFAKRWLQSESMAHDFLNKVFASPFADTAIRPLTIAHLCAIYERIQDIPEKPKSVYRRIVQLLLEDWDSQRQIKRQSLYSAFDQDRKFDFLAHLAFFLTTELKQLRFSEDSLKIAYASIHKDHGLPPSEARNVVSEIESHSGLIIESGRGYFEFAHKSLQEYLAADYIVRLPNLSLIETKVELLPNELAIATSLSSMPCVFLAELFLKTIDLSLETAPWLRSFLSRLLTEKPELNVGASEYSAIAALHILSKVGDSAEVLKLLRGAFPSDTAKKIELYYEVAGKDSMDTRFRRVRTSRQYRLPDHITAPTALLSSI